MSELHGRGGGPSAEERLRELLRSEATTVVPAGDGLARIRQRVAGRRRARRWLLPSAAVATAALVAAVLLLAPDEAHRPQTLQQATTSPTTSPTTGPTTHASPSTTERSPGPAPGDWKGAAFWPFASYEQARLQPDPPPVWVQDGLAVGERLVHDVLNLPGVRVLRTCAGCEALSLEAGGRPVGTLRLGHYTVHGTRVFTVVSVGGTDLAITSPAPGAVVSSPTLVSGRVLGVDENVVVRLLADDGTELATAGAPAGSAAPWQARLTWSRGDWAHGALVGVTRSPRDGAVSRLVLVPVRR